jgi:hypothetical protein
LLDDAEPSGIVARPVDAIEREPDDLLVPASSRFDQQLLGNAGARRVLLRPLSGPSSGWDQPNEIRGQRVVCEPPGLASAKVRQAHGYATLRTTPFL